jgi:hypothetical protein
MIAPIFLALGLVSIGWVFAQRFRARRSASWPTVNGTVRAIDSEDQSVLMGLVTYLHRPRIRYVYEIANRLYTGGRVYFGDEIVPARTTKSAGFADLDAGREITVHYNPADPDDAVLDTRAHPRLTAVARAGITLLVLAPLFYWLERHQSVLHGANIDLLAAMAVGLSLTWLRGRPD